MNHSAWPARTIKNLSYNYYFDISELVDAGYSINDVSVKIGYDQHSSDKGKISISDPIQYSGNIYYVKLSFADGSVVMPTGQSEHRSECQFRISIPDNIQGVWDPTNDYSYAGLEQGGEDAMVATDHITMYDGDTLIWGVEPDGTKPDPAVTTTTTTEQTTTTTTRATMTTTSNEIIYESAGALLLDDEPEKLTYRVGEDLDLTGLRISLKYYHGKDSCDVIYDKVSPADYPDKFTIDTSEFDSSKSGTYTIRVKASSDLILNYRLSFAEVSFKVTVEDHESTTETSPVTTTTTTASGQPTPSGAVLYGDTNLDGRVDITDAVLLNKSVAGAVVLEGDAKQNADCDGSSEIDSNDAVVLLRFLVHIINSLPSAE
jgi:hypothetical protein